MNTKEFMISLYDLLADNKIYQPREKLDAMLDENVEDYYIDVNDRGEAKIIVYTKDHTEYQITMSAVRVDE